MRVNTRRRMWQLFFAWNFLRELIVGAIAFERRFTDETAPLDAKMFLRDRERIRTPDFRHAYAFDPLPARDSEVRICRCAQKVTIETGLLRDAWSFL